MNFLQKAQLFITLLFLGKKATFTFHAGKHVYIVAIGYTPEHEAPSFAQILSTLESIVFESITEGMPYYVTIGNTIITVALVS